jgi:hypothetical protein
MARYFMMNSLLNLIFSNARESVYELGSDVARRNVDISVVPRRWRPEIIEVDGRNEILIKVEIVLNFIKTLLLRVRRHLAIGNTNFCNNAATCEIGRCRVDRASRASISTFIVKHLRYIIAVRILESIGDTFIPLKPVSLEDAESLNGRKIDRNASTPASFSARRADHNTVFVLGIGQRLHTHGVELEIALGIGKSSESVHRRRRNRVIPVNLSRDDTLLNLAT